MVVLAFIEIIFYSWNERILVFEYRAVDVGGSMVIHTFGAFFGLGVAKILPVPTKEGLKNAKV